MGRHAKNNTASSVFTYAERQMMDYGTRRKRLGKDSLRRITNCALCLKDPVMPMVWYVCNGEHWLGVLPL